MSYFDPVVAQRLDTTSVQRRWLTFLRHSATLATVLVLLVLLWGVALVCGWVTSTLAASVMVTLVIVGGLFAWGILGLVVAARPDRFQSLAAILERAHRPLLDRLNTLVFLREQNDAALRPYAECIEAQTRQVLHHSPPPFPFRWRHTLIHLAVLAVTAWFTAWFFVTYHPWRAMAAHQAAALRENESSNRSPVTPLMELPPEPKAQSEEPWGEVRVSEPGGDIHASTLDVVPLMIEAAASRPLSRVEWYSAVNGGAETPHGLPASDDPNYAVYRPELLLEDLHVEPWDVVSYYATATCEDGVTYRSELYFIEVFPFQAELDELPGGREGPSFEVLQRLSGMIERQQEILRQTEGETRRTGGSPEHARQRREQLAAEEGRLAEESRHLSAFADAQFGQQSVEDLNEHFQRAAEKLDEAKQTLADGGDLAPALQQENVGLSELVATRKRFQQLLDRHPESFRGPNANPNLAESGNPQEGPKEHIAARAERAKELEQIQQRLEQYQSVRKQLQKTLAEQRDIERSVSSNPRQGNQQNMQQLAERQKKLSESLDELIAKNSACFGSCQKACAGAQSACHGAAQAMRQGTSNAGQLAGAAGDQLQQLDNAVEQQMARQRMADAHRLKQMLDDQIAQLQPQSPPSSPGSESPPEANPSSPGGESAGKQSSSQQSSGTKSSGTGSTGSGGKSQSGNPSQGMGNQPGAVPSGNGGLQDPRQLAEQIRQVADQLRQIAEQDPTKDRFGSSLRESLGGQQKGEIEDASRQLAGATSEGQRSAAAERLQPRLEDVSQAFEVSRSGSSPQRAGRRPGRTGQNNEPLSESGQQAITQGLRQLESAARRRELGRSTPRTDTQLRSSAARNLQNGVWGMYGHNDRTDALVERVTSDLREPDFRVDNLTVQELLRQILNLRRESATVVQEEAVESDLQRQDASRFPPAYRRSIERYFQELSEQP